ncbi:MAG: Zn-dependent hydrolase [Magnetovibrio sp.]|nr:Zn-dependent hydrolase [Magnetovibrio sp.]
MWTRGFSRVTASLQHRTIRTNADRLWKSIEAINQIGATPAGGVCRLALSDEDMEARHLFRRWCVDAGCQVRIDSIGNIFARRPGRHLDRPAIMTGSHLDTQPTGGRFDGIYGVLAGLEVVRTLNDLKLETDAPVEIAVWTNEEGCRFAPSMGGSGVFAGVLEYEYVIGQKDRAGKNFGDELRRIGYMGDAPIGGTTVAAYFEAHIEQGPILEAEKKVIGVVTGGQGKRSYDVRLTGREAHAGTTPMPARHDPLKAAAQVIAGLELIAQDKAPDAVTTVGMMQVLPNSRNTIPGEVFFSVDMRHPDPDTLEEMNLAFRADLDKAAAEHQIKQCVSVASEYPATEFDPDCIAHIREAAVDLGITHRDMISGAGHDACHLAHCIPTGMIFVPCENGVSHNEAENASPSDLADGCDVLLSAILRCALD